MKYSNLIPIAKSLVKPMQLSCSDLDAATVGCALLTPSGNIYTGVCIHLSCGVGFCAEHAAIAEMIKNQETEIEAIVASGQNTILAPCGRCREMMAQVNAVNFDTNVIIGENESVKLKELLPHHWLS